MCVTQLLTSDFFIRKPYILMGCVFFLIRCNSPFFRVDSLDDLKADFKKNESFFLKLENHFSQNIDSLNACFNNETALNDLEKKTGIFFMNLDFLRDKRSDKIYIGTGNRDYSGYVFFSEEQELDCILSFTDTLKKENPSIEISLEKLSKHWVAYNKNQEAPLDVIFYNKIPETKRCYE